MLASVLQEVRIDTSLLTMIIGLGLPLITGLLMKANLATRAKTLVALVVTLVAALLRQAVEQQGLISLEMVSDFGGQLIVAIASYYGIWKPTGLGNLFPDKGIGGANPEDYGLIDGPGPDFEGE